MSLPILTVTTAGALGVASVGSLVVAKVFFAMAKFCYTPTNKMSNNDSIGPAIYLVSQVGVAFFAAMGALSVLGGTVGLGLCAASIVAAGANPLLVTIGSIAAMVWVWLL